MKRPKFKAYGQAKGTTDFVELSALSIFTKEKELRSLITFLESVADSMKKSGSGFHHEHLQDAVPKWPTTATDVIVVRSTKKNA